MSVLPRVNLLPNAIRVRRARKRAWRVWMPVNLALSAIFAGAFVGTESQNHTGDPVADQARLELENQLSSLDADIRDIEAHIPGMAQRVAAANALSANPDWGVVVQLLGRLADGEIEYRSIEIHPASESLGRDRPRPSAVSEQQIRLVADEIFAISVDGISSNNVAVSEFIMRLIESGLFRDVRLASSRRESRSDGGERYGFRVTAKIAPTTPEQTRTTREGQP